MDSKYKEFDKAANLSNPSLCLSVAISKPQQAQKQVQLIANLSRGNLQIPTGSTGVEIFSISGQRVYTNTATQAGLLALPASIGKMGLLYINFLK